MRAEVLKGHLDALLLATLAGGNVSRSQHHRVDRDAVEGHLAAVAARLAGRAARRCLAARATLT
jgi:hypothetical protein